jgi:hypothetical protein
MGSATFTTVLSMKAMLEPRMVTTRTQWRTMALDADGAQAAARICAISQGGARKFDTK